jgi:signal transduction histidine kinase
MTRKNRSKYRSLLDIIFKMTEAQDTNRILKILLDGALELVGAKYGSIFKLDYPTGNIINIHSLPSQISSLQEIPWGTGVVGKALKEKRTVIVKDNNLSQFYLKSWERMRSEIAIPIIVENIPIRVETRIETGTKRIGVLSIEHIKTNYFSEADSDLLKNLTRYAAIRIEDIESNLKLTKLRKKEREITEENKDYNQIIDLVTDSIVEILQFNDIVNISIVNLERGTIETKHIKGIPLERQEEFKKGAIHPLSEVDGRLDIQAEIILNKQIKVPNPNDPALDRKLADDFEHEKLVRVFIPMIEATNDLAIGTVECGYQKEYREYIYERDVQILESFVNHAVQALEKRKKDWLEIVTHELRNPMLGIRNHADILSRHWKDWEALRPDLVKAKLDDISTDCAILFYQVSQLEFLLGTNTSPNLKTQEVSACNEIIKVFKQLKPQLKSRGFSNDGIEYQFDDRARKMKIYTDRARLNQIIYNLLINSIKYAEEDPNKFKIRIQVDVYSQAEKEYLRIRFQDYGVGINYDESKKVFQLGYRGKEIKHKQQGSGIGLSISKDLASKIGVSLLLTHIKRPTEFQLLIPYNRAVIIKNSFARKLN